MVKLKLGKHVKNEKVSSYIYYLWLSLIAQTTVWISKNNKLCWS